MTAPSAEGAFGGVPPRKASPERGGAREAGGGVPSPTRCNGRGGSVSRRDLKPKKGKRTHLAWARKSEGTHKPIPSYSSGEWVWGRGASLREAASPPESPQRKSLREGVRGRVLLYREALSPAYFFVSLFLPNKIFEKL